MRVRFGEELNKKFIEKYVELEYLWNKEHPLHKSAPAREIGYEELRLLVNRPYFSIQDVRNKIRIFRSTYVQELKKVRNSPHYKPSLHWFHIMDNVLRKQTTELHDKNAKNVEVDQEKVDSKIPIVYEEVYMDEAEYDNNDSETYTKMENNEEYDAASYYSGDGENHQEAICEEETENHSPEVQTHKKSKRRQTYNETLNQSNNNHSATTSKNISSKTSFGETEDEFDIFGKSVAIQLRHLDLKEALNTQIKIWTLLKDARLNKKHDLED